MLLTVAGLYPESDGEAMDQPSGETHGGQRLSMSTLRLLVTNVLYRGDIEHKGVVYPGEQPALVSRELWQEVNAKHKLSRTKNRSNKPSKLPSRASSGVRNGELC